MTYLIFNNLLNYSLNNSASQSVGLSARLSVGLSVGWLIDQSASNLSIEDLDSDENVLGLPGCHLLDEGDRILESRNAARFLENVKLTKILASVLKDALYVLYLLGD